MNSGRGGSPGFSVGPRPSSNVNKSGSLHAVPPSHSMTRPGNANFVPVAPRFSQPGSSSSSYNRFQQPSATGLVDVELIPPPVAVRKQEPTSNQPLYQPGPDSPNFAGNVESNEEDPLDASVNDFNQNVKKEAVKLPEKQESKTKTIGCGPNAAQLFIKRVTEQCGLSEECSETANQLFLSTDIRESEELLKCNYHVMAVACVLLASRQLGEDVTHESLNSVTGIDSSDFLQCFKSVLIAIKNSPRLLVTDYFMGRLCDSLGLPVSIVLRTVKYVAQKALTVAPDYPPIAVVAVSIFLTAQSYELEIAPETIIEEVGIDIKSFRRTLIRLQPPPSANSHPIPKHLRPSWIITKKSRKKSKRRNTL